MNYPTWWYWGLSPDEADEIRAEEEAERDYPVDNPF